jgi:cytochrome c biogenesis protein CcmG/thiol:disulfide interchange protein DsbE
MSEENTEGVAEQIIPPDHPHWGRLIAWIGLLAFLTVLALGLLRLQQGSVGVGERIPNFTLTTFQGQQINLANLKGKVVVINFWASWCKPCEQEAADLEEAWQHYNQQNDVVFLGIDYVDTEPEAIAYLKKFNISYTNGPDLGTRIAQQFRIQGVPETYVIDQEGVLQFVQIGPFLSLSQIRSVVDARLSPLTP